MTFSDSHAKLNVGFYKKQKTPHLSKNRHFGSLSIAAKYALHLAKQVPSGAIETLGPNGLKRLIKVPIHLVNPCLWNSSDNTRCIEEILDGHAPMWERSESPVAG